MIVKIFNLNIKKYINKLFLLRKENGFTLIEVIIAFLIISIITTVLLQGTIMSIDTLKLNKVKTKAIAVANEKIELIRAMDYSNIDISSENPNWLDENPELYEDGFDVSYNITWVNGETDSYKQLEVAVSRDPMHVPVVVITQLYPGGVIESIIDYPPAEYLTIEYDTGSGGGREIKLVWTAPDTEVTIVKYKVYRNNVNIGDATTEVYFDHPGNNKAYTYYVTVIYDEDGTEIESVKSNEVTTD